MRAPTVVIVLTAALAAVVALAGVWSGRPPPPPVVAPAGALAAPATSTSVTLAPASASGWLERRTELTVRPDGPDRLAVFVVVRLDWHTGSGHQTVVTGSLDGLVPDHTEVADVAGPALADLLDRLAWILTVAVREGAEVHHDGALTTVVHTVVTPAGEARDVWRLGRGVDPG